MADALDAQHVERVPYALRSLRLARVHGETQAVVARYPVDVSEGRGGVFVLSPTQRYARNGRRLDRHDTLEQIHATVHAIVAHQVHDPAHLNALVSSRLFKALDKLAKPQFGPKILFDGDCYLGIDDVLRLQVLEHHAD